MKPAPAVETINLTKTYRVYQKKEGLWQSLRGLFHPPQLKGPYFHDGGAATLEAVVDHYIALRHLVLTAQQKSDLVEYLKSL